MLEDSKRCRRDDIPWTVARCNRLLRSISSRVATIRRIVDNFNQDFTLHEKDFKRAPIADLSPATGPPTSSFHGPLLHSPHQNGDPDWMPQPQRLASRTYGSKRQGRGEQVVSCASTNSPRAPLRTPFLRKLLRPKPDDSPLAQPAFQGLRKTADAQSQSSRSRKLPVKANTSLGEAHQQLLTAFANFLRSTDGHDTEGRKGARSFRGMCLNQVPRHIEAEQTWLEQDDAEADSNVADEIYTFLESLGTGQRAGFAGLREVVRSHGIFLVARAIADGLLKDAMVQRLIGVCQGCQAISEGQTLIFAWAERMKVDTEPCSTGIVDRLADATGVLQSSAFLFRQLAALAEQGILSKAQLTESDNIWHLVLQNLAAVDGRLDAMRFLEAYMLAPVGETPGRPSRTLQEQRRKLPWSVAVLLTAMVLKQPHGLNELPANTDCSWELQRLLHAAHTACDEIDEQSTVRPFLLSGLLATAAADGSEPTCRVVEDACQAAILSSGSVSSDEDVEFFADIAKIISHVDANTKLESVKAMNLGLARIASNVADVTHATYLKSLAVKGAMAWAEDQDDIESYDWAEDVENLFQNHTPGPDMLHTNTSFSKPTRYRWEHGISEWIQATPYTADQRIGLERPAILEDSGICMTPDDSPSRKRSRSYVDSDDESDNESDLEERDELSMQTPELLRLKEQRARKARRLVAADTEKENVKPSKKARFAIYTRREPANWEDVSGDELAF